MNNADDIIWTLTKLEKNVSRTIKDTLKAFEAF